MQLIPTISEQDSNPDVARVFDEFRKTVGTTFVPNFFKTLAHNPAVMEATWHAYRNTCRTGTVPPALKEMIFAAISTVRGCKYCESAHLAFAKVSGAEPETLNALVRGLSSLRPGKTRDVIQFAIKCAMQPATVTESDYGFLRRMHGFSTSEIVEVVGTCAFAMYATTIADAFRVETDPEFAQIIALPHPHQVP